MDNRDFDNGSDKREEIYSKVVRAGKRTYFFDVKATKADDYYLTITESKKKFNDDGKFFFEKHKLFLYKEDFIKFVQGLNEAVDYIHNEKGIYEGHTNDDESNEFSDVSFDDLDNK